MYSFFFGHSAHSESPVRVLLGSATLTIALLSTALLLGAVGEASAQDVQGQQIAVDVRDADGAPVEGAEVTLRPVQGDNTYETQAVGGGEYRGEVPLRYLNDRFEVLVDAGPRGEGTEKAQWWGAGTVMRVFVNLGSEEDAEEEPSQSSSDPESSTTGQSVAKTTSTLEIQSSLGHPITNATARLTFRSGLNVQETPTEETKTYDHLSGGAYKVQLEGLRDPGRYEYTINLSAPGHVGQTITPIALNSERSVELIHNDYVARCNKDWDDDESGFLGKESPWADCEIDPERLIETFGTKTKRFQTKPVPEGVDPRTPIEQLPSILSSFEVYRFHPKFHAAEPLRARQSQYQTLIEQIVRGPALAKAYAANETIDDLIEKRRATEEPSVEVEEVAAQGASVVAGFAEKFSAVADAIGAAGDVLNIKEANERGVLKGLIQYAVLQTGVQQEALEQFKTQAREARIWDDPAFQQAIEAVEQKLKDQRQMGPKEVAIAYARDEIGDVVGDVLLGTTVKGVVEALLAAAKAGAAVKTGGAFLAYDLLKSAIDRSQARTLLALSPLIDRQVLSEFPDNLEAADLQAMRPTEKRGALMRLTLGTVFNESRAAYLAGENKSWLGQGWDFAIESMPIGTEADAYDAEMVRVSEEKSERAETEIDRLTATLADNAGPPSDDEDIRNDDPPVADGGEDPTSDDEGETRGQILVGDDSTQVSGTPQTIDPGEGLVAYYPFSGDASDESGNGNDGTVFGATLTTDRQGNEESAYRFDGSDDRIDIGSTESLGLTDPYSIALWVKVNSLGQIVSNVRYFETGGGDLTLAPNRYRYYVGNNDRTEVSLDDSLSMGVWHHLAIVHDGNSATLYVDGEEKGDNDNFYQFSPSSLDLFIGGSDKREKYDPIEGKMDDVRIYDRPLSESEIQELYSGGSLAAPTDLSAFSTDGQIDLTWSPGGDSSPAGYNIYRSTSSFSDPSNATKLNGSLETSTNYPDTDVTNGTEYFYRVTAVDGEGNESAPSNQVSGTPQSIDLGEGLVAYYPFNGDADDASGNKNDGTVNGVTLTEDRDGNADSAYKFDGDGDYIEIPQLDFESEGVSITAWVLPQSLGGTVFSNGEGSTACDDGIRRFSVNGDGALGFKVECKFSVSGESQIQEGEWNHVSVTIDHESGEGNFYVDGSLDHSFDASGISNNLNTNQVHAFGGRLSNNSPNWFDGSIDDARLYNRALGESEVQQLYSRPAAQ